MTKRAWRVLVWLVLPAVVAAACWWKLGPVFVTREVVVTPGATGSVEWQRAGAQENGVWVGPGLPQRVRMPARGVSAWRAPGIGAEVIVRVAGVRLGAERVGSGDAWVPLRDGSAWWDGLLCAVAGMLLGAVGLALRAGRDGWADPQTCEGVDGGARAMRARDVALVMCAGAAAHGALLIWSPMMFCPDSMDYAVRAQELLTSGSMERFDALRTPGFSVLLAGLLWLGAGIVPVLGVVHATMALAMMWMAMDVVGRSAGRWWGVAAGLLVGLNPLTLVWARHAMPELSAMWCSMGALWCLGRVGGGDRACGCAGARLGWAAAAGLCCAGAAYLRGNLQVLVVLAPLTVLLGGGTCWDEGVRRRLRAAVVCGVVAILAMVPWVVRNHRVMGVAAFAVGSNYARVLNGWDAGVIDLNQHAVWDAERVRAMSEPGAMRSGFDALRAIDAARIEGIPKRHPWIESEARRGVVAAESLERWADRRWSSAWRAGQSVSGLWPVRGPGYRENAWWVGGLVEGTPTGTNFWNVPADYGHLDRGLAQRVYDANAVPTKGWTGSMGARVIGAWSQAWVVVWPVVAVLGLAGAACAWRRGLVGHSLLAVVPMGHAAALAVLTLTGIDRYQAPLGAWMLTVGVVAAAGLSRGFGSVIRR